MFEYTQFKKNQYYMVLHVPAGGYICIQRQRWPLLNVFKLTNACLCKKQHAELWMCLQISGGDLTIFQKCLF